MAKIEATTLSINALVSIYNILSENPVRRFADKSTAAKRVQLLLDARSLIISDTIVGEDVVTVSDSLWLVDANAKVRERKASTRAVYGEEEIIEINVAAFTDKETGNIVIVNPKRAGTKAHARMQLLIDAVSMTVGEYLDACAKLEGGVKPRHKYRIDLTWDIEHGFITFPNGADY